MSAEAKDVGAGPDPRGIMALSTAYWASQTLLTANRIGLFDALAAGPLTADEVADRLSLDARAAGLFLNALSALGLCEKAGDRYGNSAASRVFLVSQSPASMRNALAYTDDTWDAWGELETSLRSGRPSRPPADYLGADEEETRHFVYGMHDRALAIGRALPSILDLEGRQRMLDVGGGPGTFSALLTEANPGLRADVLELPGVAAVAERILAETGAAERVSLRHGDYHETDFGEGYDVVLMSGMFHRESAASCQRLIGKAHACLEPGGLLVVSDVFTEDDGSAPEFATLFGLNMMLTADDGCVHADADVERWMQAAGFADTGRRPFPPPMPHRVVTGVKR